MAVTVRRLVQKLTGRLLCGRMVGITEGRGGGLRLDWDGRSAVFSLGERGLDFVEDCSLFSFIAGLCLNPRPPPEPLASFPIDDLHVHYPQCIVVRQLLAAIL